MNAINERFKEVRNHFNKTQLEWGEIIGITRGGIASIESGSRNVTEKHLKILSQYKNGIVNIDWIRTGEGSMLRELSKNDEVSNFLNDMMELKDEDFKKRFIIALSKLNKDDWSTIKKIVDELAGEG